MSARSQPSLALDILGYAAGLRRSDTAPAIRVPAATGADESQLRHTIESGLAPLLHHAMQTSPGRVPPAWRDALQSVDLTAKVRAENCRKASIDVIDVCLGAGVRPTLLKGISVSHQYYPAPHLRPMGDIDILVPEIDLERVEATLLRNGMIRQPDRVRPTGSHHGVPLFHPKQHVWIEIHSGLFPKDSDVNRGTLFGPGQIAANSVDSTFAGRPVRRLTDELQLVYIAASWIRDLSNNEIHPSLVLPLLDAVYLHKASANSLDWDRLLESIHDSELAAASLYLMLTYLSRRGLVACPASLLSAISSRQRIVGMWELGLIDFLLDAYLVGGRPFGRFSGDWTARTALNTALQRGSHLGKLFALPWNIAFPPSVASRFSVGFHARRIARIFRNSGREQN